ncbi:MAG TPA: hypothetical protein VL326_33815 [Kofleriaceae bacterium]|nr:hypothetical protein [Kofleriaceae bacterium]
MKLLVAALLLLAGCGGCGDDAARTDGGDDGDGSVDGDIDADPNVRGTVTVHVVDKLGIAVPGIDVVFNDTDATLTQAVTDATGIVQASVFPNASVTALRQGNNSYSLTTLLALNPGDDITLVTAWEAASAAEDPFSVRVLTLPSADLASASKSGSTGTFTTVQPHGLAIGDTVIVEDTAPAGYNTAWTVATVSATGFTASGPTGGLGNATTLGTAAKGYPFTFTYSTASGATGYTVYTSCGPTDVGTSLTPQLVMAAGCTAASMTVLVVARNAGGAFAYAQKTGVTITAGGNTTITDTWHPIDSLSVSYTNQTTRVTDILADRYVPYVRVAAVDSDVGPTFTMTTPSSATAFMKTRVRCPMGAAPDCLSNNIGSVSQSIVEQVDGTLASYSLDLGANLLPWVTATYTQATTSIDVTVTGTGAIDLFETNLRYTGMTGTPRANIIYTWRVFGPLAQGVTFPTLPSTLPGDPTVRTTDVQSQFQVYLCETDAVNGYRAAIKNPYATLATCEVNGSTTVKPMSATKSRLSQWN